MKRSLFRTVVLPLFLCAAILAFGYFSPTLYSRVMPDYLDTESTVSVAGAENPLYLEDPSGLVLPPWNDISDIDSRVYAQNGYDPPEILRDRISQDLYFSAENYGDDRLYTLAETLADTDLYVETTDAYVRGIIQPFLKGCHIQKNMKFSEFLHMYDPEGAYYAIPKYIYAQNVTVKTEENRDFTVDFVFSPQSGLPVYVHASEVDVKTAAEANSSAFIDAITYAMSVFFYAENPADADTPIPEPSESALSGNADFTVFYKAFAGMYSEFFADFISENADLSSAEWATNLWSRLRSSNIQNWYGFFLNTASVYSIDYQNESLLMLRTDSGCTMTITYDALSESVTGFGMDPNWTNSFLWYPFYEFDTEYASGGYTP